MEASAEIMADAQKFGESSDLKAKAAAPSEAELLHMKMND